MHIFLLIELLNNDCKFIFRHDRNYFKAQGMKDSEIDSYIILSIYNRVDINSVLNENKEKESQIIKILKSVKIREDYMNILRETLNFNLSFYKNLNIKTIKWFELILGEKIKIPYCWKILAIKEGNLNVLKWFVFRDKNCFSDEKYEYLRVSISFDKIHVLKYICFQNLPCEWSKDHCYFAVNRNNLKILKWLRSQNPPCPWNKTYCLNLCESEEMRKWILNQEEIKPFEKENIIFFQKEDDYI